MLRYNPVYFRHCGVAIATVILALCLTLIFDDLIQPVISPLFFAAVAVSAWYGGLIPGLLSTALAVLTINFFFISPLYAFNFVHGADLVQILTFGLVASMISSLSEELRRSKRRLETSVVRLRQSEEQYRQLIDTAQEGIWLLNPDLEIEYANQRLLELLGYSSEALIGRSILGLIDAASHEVCNPLNFGDRPAGQFERCYRRHDGAEVWVLVSRNPRPDASGHSAGFLEMMTDITERKHAEHVNFRWLQIFEDAGWGIAISSADGNDLSMVNRTFAHMHGYSVAELSRKPIVEVFAPHMRAQLAAHIQMIHERKHYMFESLHQRKDGSLFPVLISGTIVKDDQGNPLYRAIHLQDLTTEKHLIAERQRIEQALQVANQRMIGILESITDAFFAVDLNWNITYANRRFEEIAQRSRHNLLGNNLWEVFPDAVGSTFYREYHRALVESTPVIVEGMSSNGSGRWFEARAYPSAEGLAVYLQDISDRKQAEADMQASEALYRTLAEAMPHLVWSIRPDGTLDYANQHWYHSLGLTLKQVNQLGWNLVLHPDDLLQTRQHWKAMTQAGVAGQLEVRLRMANGLYRWFLNRFVPLQNSNGEILKWIVTSTDTDDRRRDEEALRQQADDQQTYRRWLEEVLNRLPSPVLFIEPETAKVMFANKAANDMAGGNFLKARLDGGDRSSYFCTDSTGEAIPPEELPSARVAQGEKIHAVELTWHSPSGARPLLIYGDLIPAIYGHSATAVMVFQEISERKRLEQQLHRREQQFRTLAENAPDIITRFDRHLRYLYVNRELERATGIAPETFVGKTNAELPFPPALYQQWEAGLRQVFDTGQRGALEFNARFHQQMRYYQTQIVPEFAADGSVESVLGITRDVTDYKQVENALRQSEARSRRILESNVIGMGCWNAQGTITLANDALLEIVGCCRNEFEQTGLHWSDLTFPDEVPFPQPALQEIAEIGYCRPFEKEFVCQDGSIVPVLCGAARFEDDLTSGVFYVINLTEHKQSELEREMLLARERRYTRQLHELTKAFLEINAMRSVEEVVRVITEQARAIIGAHQGLTSINPHQNWGDAIHTISLSDRYADWQNYTEKPDGTGIYTYVCEINQPLRLTQAELETHPRWRGFGKAAGHHPPLRGWLAVPLRGRNDQNMGLIQLSDKYEGDFTEEDQVVLVQLAQMASVTIEGTRLYEAEQQARTQAEAANRIKDEFLAVLSHELRTPLNPILGWAQLLRTRTYDEKATQRALEIIERNARLQTQLIEDLLDVSRILQGKLSLSVASVNWADAIDAALETVRLAAEAKAIQITTQLDRALGEVWGDAGRLQQVVWNLLSNAIKFTPQGGQVEVRLECSDGLDHSQLPHPPHLAQSYARLTITDTGKGIDPNFLPFVFDYFRQADGSTTRTFGGLGLGLAIVRHLIELHGGTVWAESPGEGQGATFTVQLPLKSMSDRPSHVLEPDAPLALPPDAMVPSANVAQCLQDTTILVVDDEPDVRDLLTVVLNQHGANVITVASAFEALSVLRNYQPDLLISDVGMPGMDGYMLIRQVRKRSPDPAHPIPAIALTAYATTKDEQQAIAAGFDRHIAKPFDPDKFVAVVSQCLPQRSAEE